MVDVHHAAIRAKPEAHRGLFLAHPVELHGVIGDDLDAWVDLLDFYDDRQALEQHHAERIELFARVEAVIIHSALAPTRTPRTPPWYRSRSRTLSRSPRRAGNTAPAGAPTRSGR